MTRTLPTIALVALLTAAADAQACGRCRSGHARHARAACVVAPPTMATAPTYAPPAATPQAVQAPAPISESAAIVAAARPMPAPAPPAGEIQPTYNYAAADQGQPAYYYTYDNSGKLIVSQWVDYVFRGGKAEGMPRPPLPIIGRFGNRD